MKKDPNRWRYARLCLSVISAFILVCSLQSVSSAAEKADPVYASLERLIAQTPPEAMTVDWLVKKIYQGYPNPQKMLKKILGAYPARNEKMGRLRQAIDLGFWIHVAKVKGWTIELTNQGKTNGHRSDLDQTGWALVGPEGEHISRDRAFSEVQGMWEDWLSREHGITPGKPDMTIFDGDAFLPDWTNAKMGSKEFIQTLSKEVLKLRQNGEAYYAPGANKSQVHTRPLQEGRTIHIGWHEGKAWINGVEFDLGKFIAGERAINFLPTREVAIRYRGVSEQPPWRLALGNAAENTRRFLTHLDDPLAAKKYLNRVVNEALVPVTAVAYSRSHVRPITYMEVHRSNLTEQRKLDFKRKFIEQAFGLGPGADRAQVDRIMELLDRSHQIELDKINNEPYQPEKYYGEELGQLGKSATNATSEDLANAEALFNEKLTELALEGTVTVLEHAIEQDMTPKGRRRNRADYGENHREGLRKLFFERRVEIAFLFEAVEALGSKEFREASKMEPEKVERLRETYRKKLLDTAKTPGMRKLLERMSKLVQAQGIDLWLETAMKTGRVPRPEEIIAEMERRLKGVEAEPETRAKEVSDAELRERALEWNIREMGAGLGRRYRTTLEVLKKGLGTISSGGQQLVNKVIDQAGLLLPTASILNLVHTYQTECALGGKRGWACQQAVLQQGLQESIWYIPSQWVQAGYLVGSSLYAIGEGQNEGYFTLGLGGAAFAGYPGAMHLYFLYHVAKTGIDVTYGYAVAAFENDFVKQAFQSWPNENTAKPATRSGPRTFPTADTPNTPIMWEVDVPSNHWSMAKRRRVVWERYFRRAIFEELSRRNLKPFSSEWESQRADLIRQYAFDLPYHERMARIYEHFKPQIPGNPQDTFYVLDGCVEERRAATGGNEEFSLYQVLPACLQSAMKYDDYVLDSFFDRYLEGWLAKQRPGYHDNFFDWWSRMFGTGEYKRKVFAKLKAVLKRQYVLSQYNTLKRQEQLRELDTQLRISQQQQDKIKVVKKAAIAVQKDAEGDYRAEYIGASSSLYRQPVAPVRPKVTLNLPDWAVRMGEKAPIEVEVRGERDSTAADDAPANQWEVEYRTQRQSIRTGRPPGLIITKELAEELNEEPENPDDPKPKFYRIDEKVVAIVRNKAGQVLGKAEGVIHWYDVRRPGKEEEEQPATASGEEQAGDAVYFVIKVEGKGYVPHLAGGSWSIAGENKRIFTLKRGEDLKTALKAHCEELVGHPERRKKIHVGEPGARKRPLFWYKGPLITVMSDAFTDKKKALEATLAMPPLDTWKKDLNSNHGTLQQLKKKYKPRGCTISGT